MTFIAGVRCSNGLLLVSDREESGGPLKTSARKIFDFVGSQFQLGVATAGYSALADKAVKRIEDAASGAKFADRHERILEAELRELYDQYIWPEEVPDGHEREIELIIGIHRTADQQYLLYRAC